MRLRICAPWSMPISRLLVQRSGSFASSGRPRAISGRGGADKDKAAGT